MGVIRPTTVFTHAHDPAALPAELALRAVEWGVFFSATGRTTVAEIGHSLGLADADRDQAFERLLAAGLLVERELVLGEYLRAAAHSGEAREIELAEFLRAPAARLVESAEPGRGSVAPIQPDAVANPPHSSSEPTLRPGPPVVSPGTLREPGSPPPFEPLGRAAAAPRPRRRLLSLRALLAAITGRASTPEAGQLDVYRVFLRVDRVLLERNGITTLRFAEDRQIADPALQEDIAAAVEAVLGFAVPAGVWREQEA